MRRVDALDELRAAVQGDPRRVAEAAAPLVAAARAADDPVALSRALGVLGRARRALGDIALAETDLLAAVAAAERAGDDELAADAHIGVAGVLIFGARTTQAYAHLDDADRLGSPRLQAYASLQRAALSQHLGRVDDALATYERALPILRAIGADTDVALVLMNRGTIRGRRGEHRAALDDLTEARALFAAGGHRYGMAQTEHNLGLVHARAGALATALTHLDLAAAQFAALGHDGVVVDVDRVDLLLDAGLFVTAGAVAREAAARASAAGDVSHAAQLWLAGARAGLLDGERERSAADADRARELFEQQGAAGWAAAAELEVHRARGGTSAGLEALAGRLAAAGDVRGTASALALGAIAAADDDDAPAATRLATASTVASSDLEVAELRVLAAMARSRAATARGDLASAMDEVRAGLDGLRGASRDVVTLDARAAAAVHGAELARHGVRLALRAGSPLRVLQATELARAGRGRDVAGGPGSATDPQTSAALGELRTTAAALRAAGLGADERARLVERQTGLERGLQRRALQLAGERRDTGPAAPSGSTLVDDALPERLVAALAETGAGTTLVSLVEVDGCVVGVRVDRAGHAAMADLGPAASLHAAAGAASSALRQALRPGASTARRRAASALLTRAVGAIDLVLAGLGPTDGALVLVVPPSLHTVPWHLLPSAAARPVCVAPSAAWWAGRALSPVAPPAGPVVVVAGPRLAEADAEATAVAGCHPGAHVLRGAGATSGAVVAAMPGAPLVHVASHARLRTDNPSWSSLELADGPLYAYDLERLPEAPPVVVLSGCDTGAGVRAGDELLGLSSVLLHGGTRTLVASLCPLPDSAETREHVVALHRRLAAGERPAAALAAATAERVLADDPATAAALGCFGTH